MKYSSQKLAKALLKMIQDNPGDQKKVISAFVDFCQKKKLGHLFSNLKKYLEIESKRRGNLEALKIISAVRLSEENIKGIRKIAGADLGDTVELTEDKNITAGFIAYYKNKIIDASLSNNLVALKNKLINA